MIPTERQALFFAVAAYAGWSASDAAQKLGLEMQITSIEAVAFCGLFGLILTGAAALLHGKKKDLWPKQPGPVFLRAGLGFVTILLNFFAFPLLSLPTFYTIVFLTPMLIAVLGHFLLHEKLSRAKGGIILIGFIGALVAVDPASLAKGNGSALGASLAFGGVLTFACAQLLLRRLSGTEKTTTLVFTPYLVLFSAGTLLSLLDPMVPDWKAVAFIFFSMFFSVAGNFAMVRAMKKAEAATVGSLHYTQIIWGTLFGYVIWHEGVTANLVVGSAIIVASGLAMSRFARRSGPRTRMATIEAT